MGLKKIKGEWELRVRNSAISIPYSAKATRAASSISPAPAIPSSATP